MCSCMGYQDGEWENSTHQKVACPECSVMIISMKYNVVCCTQKKVCHPLPNHRSARNC
jgi:hypothetical protein